MRVVPSSPPSRRPTQWFVRHAFPPTLLALGALLATLALAGESPSPPDTGTGTGRGKAARQAPATPVNQTAKERQASESRVAVQADRKALSEQLESVAPKDRAAAIRAWEQSNAGAVEEAARLKREALLERTRAVRAASRGKQR